MEKQCRGNFNKDSRRHQRFPWKKKVNYQTDNRRYLGELKNISIGGLCLKPCQPLLLESTICLELPLPKMSYKEGTTSQVILKGKVVWTTSSLAGIIFNDLPLQSLQILQKFFKKYLLLADPDEVLSFINELFKFPYNTQHNCLETSETETLFDGKNSYPILDSDNE